MQTNLDYETIRGALIRATTVSVVAVIFSVIVFGSQAFNLHAVQFELMLNGVAIAVAYAAFKSHAFQDEYAATSIWGVFIMGILLLPLGVWGVVSTTSYIVGLTASTYLYYLLVSKHSLGGRYGRVVAAILILGFGNALIFSFLQVLGMRMPAQSPAATVPGVRELWEGAMIAIVSGIAMEFSDWLVEYSRHRETVVN